MTSGYLKVRERERGRGEREREGGREGECGLLEGEERKESGKREKLHYFILVECSVPSVIVITLMTEH